MKREGIDRHADAIGDNKDISRTVSLPVLLIQLKEFNFTPSFRISLCLNGV